MSPLHELTTGGLEGLAGLAFASLEPESLFVALRVVGDALRLELVLPDAVQRQLRGPVSEAQVLAAIDAATATVGRWALPASLGEDDDPDLVWALRRRDEIESLLLSARRILLPHGILVDTSPNVARLHQAIAAHDLSCGGKLMRSEAERMLAERIEVIGKHSWLDTIAWAAEPADAGAQPLQIEAALREQVRPDLDSLEAYVVHGRLKSWVEAAAARWQELAEDLEEMIDIYREHGRAGMVARRWQKERLKLAAVTFAAPAPSTRRAAADQEQLPGEASVEYPLGTLAPLEAEGSLRIGEGWIELTVFAGEVALSEVKLGGIQAEAPKEGGTWRVRTARDDAAPSAEFEIVVADSQGNRFEAPIRIEPAAP